MGTVRGTPASEQSLTIIAHWIGFLAKRWPRLTSKRDLWNQDPQTKEVRLQQPITHPDKLWPSSRLISRAYPSSIKKSRSITTPKSLSTQTLTRVLKSVKRAQASRMLWCHPRTIYLRLWKRKQAAWYLRPQVRTSTPFPANHLLIKLSTTVSYANRKTKEFNCARTIKIQLSTRITSNSSWLFYINNNSLPRLPPSRVSRTQRLRSSNIVASYTLRAQSLTEARDPAAHKCQTYSIKPGNC